MEINAHQVDLFNDLTQICIGEKEFDLHNDFNCIQIKFIEDIIYCSFRHVLNAETIDIKFVESKMILLEFDFIEKFESLTIENLYRGRFEIEGKLLEYQNECGYFYLEFCEGQKIEFWCKSIVLELGHKG